MLFCACSLRSDQEVVGRREIVLREKLRDLAFNNPAPSWMEGSAKVAKRSPKLVLTDEQKLQRQTKHIGRILRAAIRHHRKLGGKTVRPDAWLRQINAASKPLRLTERLIGLQLKSIAGVFKAVDTDNSGDVDREEFRKAMNRLGLGLSWEQIGQCVDVLDKDGDGVVSLKEFMALAGGGGQKKKE